jgi:hypothetical protein
MITTEKLNEIISLMEDKTAGPEEYANDVGLLLEELQLLDSRIGIVTHLIKNLQLQTVEKISEELVKIRNEIFEK